MNFKTKEIILALCLIQMSKQDCLTADQFKKNFQYDYETDKIINFLSDLSDENDSGKNQLFSGMNGGPSYLLIAQKYSLGEGSETDHVKALMMLQNSPYFGLRVFPTYLACVNFEKIKFLLATYQEVDQIIISENPKEEVIFGYESIATENEINDLLEIFFYLYPIAALHSLGITKPSISKKSYLTQQHSKSSRSIFIGSLRNSYFLENGDDEKSKEIVSMFKDYIEFDQIINNKDERAKMMIEKDLLMLAILIYNQKAHSKNPDSLIHFKEYNNKSYFGVRNEITKLDKYLKSDNIKRNLDEDALHSLIEKIFELVEDSKANPDDPFQRERHYKDLGNFLKTLNDQKLILRSIENLPSSSIMESRRRRNVSIAEIAYELSDFIDKIAKFLFKEGFKNSKAQACEKIKKKIGKVKWSGVSESSKNMSEILKKMVGKEPDSYSILETLYQGLRSKIFNKDAYKSDLLLLDNYMRAITEAREQKIRENKLIEGLTMIPVTFRII
jgi:hypothetical protein